MYKPIIKLDTNICKICKKKFKSEKALKDHIFSFNIKDKKHLEYKKILNEIKYRDAKKICPICNAKLFRNLGMHLSFQKDLKHKKFKKNQIRYLINSFLIGYSPLDISKINNKYTNYFGQKYIYINLLKELGRNKFDKISKEIKGEKRKSYWRNVDEGIRKKIMKKVRESQWGSLTKEQKRNHPWVKAGLKASLESTKKGSKNQKNFYKILKKEFPHLYWRYNYALDDGWHIDIACPDKNIFVEWDGRHHRIPIHGIPYLNNRKNRDKIKDKIVTKDLKGVMIRIRDEGRENLNFVKKKVEEIKILVNNSKNTKKVIYL